jgi:hypothetical protein
MVCCDVVWFVAPSNAVPMTPKFGVVLRGSGAGRGIVISFRDVVWAYRNLRRTNSTPTLTSSPITQQTSMLQFFSVVKLCLSRFKTIMPRL